MIIWLALSASLNFSLERPTNLTRKLRFFNCSILFSTLYLVNCGITFSTPSITNIYFSASAFFISSID